MNTFIFILTNNADPDEMPPNVAFLLGLHYLPKYLFTSIQNEKGYFNSIMAQAITFYFLFQLPPSPLYPSLASGIFLC